MDPIDLVSRWNAWCVTGSPNQIDDTLTRLDAGLPGGWQRLTEEQVRERHLDRFQGPLSARRPVWYATNSPSNHGGANVSLDRIRDTDLRGGLVLFNGPAYPVITPQSAGEWDRIVGFLEGSIIPAARAAGANPKAPTPEEIFLDQLPSSVGDALRRFSRGARKVLPLNAMETESWNGFVIAAFRSRAIIDSRLLVEWLVVDGWKRDAAESLDSQLSEQCLLLSRFAEEVLAV
ncbi:hypothetical protein OJF2_41980 [Aquisphaera giovannonii]|uniref:Uncharacterized protein n=1 Tax=Aquisphaera giovannonii TaxID=406548 RepID=A0A5B9W530_9BACT|nr:hypothetical protein [Aquisphaera giovannonii]QEH35643.1 hypothetical protein OJF2_41980 [Aquisphaera giovannonii]